MQDLLNFWICHRMADLLFVDLQRGLVWCNGKSEQAATSLEPRTERTFETCFCSRRMPRCLQAQLFERKLEMLLHD